jgi:hypothetical protein
MELVSDIFSSNIFPNSILAGLDPPIQLWIDGPAYLPCPVKPSVLDGFSGCRPRSSAAPWGHGLMPKAPLFFDHFDWIPIGNSERIVLLCAGSWPSWPSVASGEGKQVVIAAIPRDRFTRKRPRAIGKPLDTSMY